MRTLLADARRGHAGLTAVTLVLMLVDQRTLLGQPLWAKPFKFSVSLGLYSLAMAWMLGQLRDRIPRRAGWIMVGTAAIEMVFIVEQAARGVRSHFNDDTPFDAVLFGVMGLTITVFWFATLAVAVRFLREKGRDRSMTLAIRLGLVVALAGMAVGYVMAVHGAHSVGARDGGPGLPLVGWNTLVGDLRPAHFIGLHALQVLPLVAALLARRTLTEDGRMRIVATLAAGYLAAVALLVWQALRAQPLLAPDGLTLGALAVVVLGVAAGVASGLRRRTAVTVS